MRPATPFSEVKYNVPGSSRIAHQEYVEAMKKLLAIYLDWIDTCAYNNVEDYSGRDVPYFHTFVLWAIAAIISAEIDSGTAIAFAALACLFALWASWVIFIMIFYRRAKVRHRLALGIPDWREKMAQDAEEASDDRG